MNETPRIVPGPRWDSNQAAPVDPLDTFRRARAQSLLTGSLLGGKVCPPLTTEQADDVLRWANAA